MSKQSVPNIWEGMAAGIVGGLVASYVMGEFQNLWTHYAVEKKAKGAAKKTRKQEPTTVKAASAISEGVFAHKLTKAEKEIAGPAVHYAMGAASGAVYGATAELVPTVTSGAGMPFGAMVWLAADDITLPAVGLAKWPTEYPLSTHAYALASHLVYGITTEAVRRAVRSIF